jgi:hypothetical protein
MYARAWHSKIVNGIQPVYLRGQGAIGSEVPPTSADKRLSIRDQEVGGSNPLAPILSFIGSTGRKVTGKWLCGQAPFLIPRVDQSVARIEGMST